MVKIGLRVATLTSVNRTAVPNMVCNFGGGFGLVLRPALIVFPKCVQFPNPYLLKQTLNTEGFQHASLAKQPVEQMESQLSTSRIESPFSMVTSLDLSARGASQETEYGALHVTFIGVTRGTELTQDMALSERPGQNTLPLTVSVF